MEKDSKIFIIALFIIFIIVFISLNFHDLTGKAVKQQKIRSITILSENGNDIAEPGKIIDVTVDPFNIIYHKSVRIFNSEDKQIGRFDMRNCSIYCHQEETSSYRLPNELEPGIYYVKVFDHTNQEFVKTYFTVA